MKSILVTGANGQVGQEIQALADQFPDFNFLFADLPDLDITAAAGINSLFEKHQFSYCINCAAYTAVDRAEDDADLTYKVNVHGVENLAKAGLPFNTQLIQLSTDYVYHNQQNTPFKEGDATHPQGVYASTKLQGDEIALEIAPGSMIVRTSWVYSTFGHNFVKTMLRLGRSKEELSIVFDQIGTPTYAHDLAKALLTIITKVERGEQPAADMSGIFHYSNEGVTSWYDFAKAIFRNKDIECKVRPIETKDYPTPAKRPHFSLLNKSKIKETFGITIPHWEDSLRSCLSKLD